MAHLIRIIIVCCLTFGVTNSLMAQQSALQQADDATFLPLLVWMKDDRDIDEAVERLNDNWVPGYIPVLLESAVLATSPRMRSEIFTLLATHTGQNFGADINKWFTWLWNEPPNIIPEYSNFKGNLFLNIDPKFETYFKGRQDTARIRLDEIRWGGVKQDGIPPLRNPVMIDADDADYMQDDNIVFGIEINGDARAYPKRILAWHEMFIDTVGDTEVAGIYCTLCGTVIPYKTQADGKSYDLGTSGFLYRSNKLMYDQKTQSLWNTLMGEPVLGPLAGQGIRLDYVGVVTTTWKEWLKRHPDTKVLPLDTGFERNYDEGEAYKEYFETDSLMFTTPFNDTRLKNKQEILALRFAASPGEQLAIDTDYLKSHPVYSDQVGLQNLVVFTDSSGANRAYDAGDVTFTGYDQHSTVTDNDGGNWIISEGELTSDDGRTLERLPAHRAFWFGWYAAFPETRLIK